MDFAKGLHNQQKSLDKLISEVDGLLHLRRAGANADRVDYDYIGEVTFLQGDTNARDIVFTVPEGVDFVAERLTFYPSFRFVTTDVAGNGPNEISFRPCIFSSYEGVWNPTIEVDQAALDVSIAMAETYYRNGQAIDRAYQNIPTPVQLMYSGPVNYRRGGATTPAGQDAYYSTFEFPSGLLFDVDYLLPSGSTLTIKIAPTLASLREDPAQAGSDQTRQNEYRVQAVLEGYKKVKR